jgi:hypothetical protein
MALGACPWPMLSQDSGPAHLAQVEAVWRGERSPSRQHPLGAWLVSELLWQEAPTLAETVLTAPHVSVRHVTGQPLQLARLRLAGQPYDKAPQKWASTTQGNAAWRASARPAWVTLADTPTTVGSLPELMHLHPTDTPALLPLTPLPLPTLHPHWVDVCHAWLAWYETHHLSTTLTVLPNEAAAQTLSQWWQRRQAVGQPTLLPVVWPRLPLQQQATMLNHWLGEPHHLIVIGHESLHPALWAWEQHPELAALPLRVTLLYDKPPYRGCSALVAWQARYPQWQITKYSAQA